MKNILTVDIGNSVTSLCLVKNKTVRELTHFDTILSTGNAFDFCMAEHLAALPDDTDGIMLCSVVPAATEINREYLARKSSLPVRVLTAQSPMPIKIAYKTPQTLGADRITTAVGAVALVGAPVIIIDIGTAITVVDQSGTFLGGAILPGPETSARALADFTAQLPFVPTAAPPAIGTDTTECIRFGIVQGTVGAIDRLIELIWQHIGMETKIVFTGGDSKLIADLTQHKGIFSDSLIACGLAECWRAANSAPNGQEGR